MAEIKKNEEELKENKDAKMVELSDEELENTAGGKPGTTYWDQRISPDRKFM